MELNDIVHSRLKEKCIHLYEIGLFTESARESLLQVEIAIKEKFPFENRKLNIANYLNKYFIDDQTRIDKAKLISKLNDNSNIKSYFRSVFAHYRNNLFHEDISLTQQQCLRIIIIASELLDILDVSHSSYFGNNLFQGFRIMQIFDKKEEMINLMKLLDGMCLPVDTPEWLFEDLYKAGFSEIQLETLMEYGLISSEISFADGTGFEEDIIDSEEEIICFYLTDLGKKEIIDFENEK